MFSSTRPARCEFPLMSKKLDLLTVKTNCKLNLLAFRLIKIGLLQLNSMQVKYKEILDLEAKLNMVEALATVKKNVLFAEIKGD